MIALCMQLGRFVHEEKCCVCFTASTLPFGHTSGPLEHHFFWADNSQSKLCWCRDERYKRNHNSSRVLSVHRGPSQTVKCRLDYAPLYTHRHVFHVVLEDSVLDLLCYGEKSFELWLSEVGGLAVGDVLANTGTSLEPKNCADVFCNISVTSAEFEV